MAAAYTILDQEINKIHGHLQLIVEEKDLTGIGRGKSLAQVLLAYVDQLCYILVLLKLLDPGRGESGGGSGWHGIRLRRRSSGCR